MPAKKFLVFIINFTILVPFLTNCNDAEYSIGMQDLSRALTRLLHFLDEQHRVINVDCIFCIRIVEGQLASIGQDYADGKLPHVHNTLISSLNQLQQKSAAIVSQGIKYTLGRNPSYIISFLRVIDTPFQVKRRVRQIQHIDGPVGGSDNFNEEASDNCLRHLLGSSETEPCTVSNECWQFVTMTGTTGYTATHQVLFLLIAEKVGCMHRLAETAKERGQMSIDQLYQRLCSSIYHEAFNIAKNEIFPKNDGDLFMEQIAICSLAGFSEFLKPAWLQLVLSWQSVSGCYGSSDDSNEDEKEAFEFYDVNKEPSKQNEHLEDNIVQQFDNGDIRRGVKPADVAVKFTGRKLLREAVLPNTGGCLSHMSGIAAACLVMFFHYFLSSEHYTKELLSNHGDIGIDLEGRVIHIQANDIINIQNSATDEVKMDAVHAVGNNDPLPIQSILLFCCAVCLTICCIKNMRRGNTRSWLKRVF